MFCDIGDISSMLVLSLLAPTIGFVSYKQNRNNKARPVLKSNKKSSTFFALSIYLFDDRIMRPHQSRLSFIELFNYKLLLI